MVHTAPGLAGHQPPVEVDVDVRPLGPDRAMLITPDGRRFEIDKPVTELVQALDDVAASQRLAGEGADPASTRWPDLANLLRSSRGLASAEPEPMAGLLLLADASLTGIVESLADSSDDVHTLPDSRAALRSELAAAADQPVVLLRDRFDSELLLAVDEIRARTGGSWTPFHLDQARAWLGPVIEPGRSASYRDLVGRRRCAVQRADVAEALLAPSAVGPLRLPATSVLTWLVGLLLAEVRRCAAGQPSALVGNEMEVDPYAPAIHLHPLLPLPDADLPDPGLAARNDRVEGVDLLRDKRLGVVTATWAVEHDPSIPRALKTVQAEVADMARLYPWAPNTVCGGSAFGDLAAADAAAIGESVERYCGNWVRPELLRKESYATLKAAGDQALDPESVVLYSPAQYREPGFPFVPFSCDLPVQWVAGRSLTTGATMWVPASFVYVNWYVGPYADEPATNYPFYAGLAAGPSFDDAVRAGLEEIIERDATMIWWANRQPLPAVELPTRLAGLFDGEPAAHGQVASLVYVDNTFDVPVMAGILEYTLDRTVAIGFAARPTAEQAALKAWAEALTLQEISRDLQQPDGLFWQAVRGGYKRQGFIKPWRDDRAYLDDFRPDFRDVGDLECQLQVHLDPRSVDTVRPWLGSTQTRRWDDLPSLADRSLGTYQRLVECKGYHVVAVDLTTPDVAASGLRVVRVLVPGLVSNYPAAFPFNGRRRLQDAAVALGWRDQPLPESDLTTFPLPHA